MTTENTALAPHAGLPTADVTVIRHTRSSRIAAGACILALAAMVSMPWWGHSGHIRWVVEFSVYLTIAQMWNLLAGYGGLVSVGPQAFVGVAGYTLFVLASNFGINPFLAVWLSIVIPGCWRFRPTPCSTASMVLTSPSAPGLWPRLSSSSSRTLTM